MNSFLVDFFILLVFVQIFFIWSKNDLISEVIRFLGVICATFVALHYYSRFATFLNTIMIIPKKAETILAYSVLSGLVLVMFALLREGWLLILDVKFSKEINQWGSGILSLIRLYLLSGLVFLGLIVYGDPAVTQAARHSTSAVFLRSTSTSVYHLIYSGVIVRIFPGETVNENIIDLTSDSPKDRLSGLEG